jgi:hypothetical protein
MTLIFIFIALCFLLIPMLILICHISLLLFCVYGSNLPHYELMRVHLCPSHDKIEFLWTIFSIIFVHLFQAYHNFHFIMIIYLYFCFVYCEICCFISFYLLYFFSTHFCLFYIFIFHFQYYLDFLFKTLILFYFADYCYFIPVSYSFLPLFFIYCCNSSLSLQNKNLDYFIFFISEALISGKSVFDWIIDWQGMEVVLIWRRQIFSLLYKELVSFYEGLLLAVRFSEVQLDLICLYEKNQYEFCYYWWTEYKCYIFPLFC